MTAQAKRRGVPALEDVKRYWVEVFESGDLGLLDRHHVGKHYVLNGVHMVPREIRAWCRKQISQYENRSMAVLDTSFECGSRAVLFWEFTGTRDGEPQQLSGVNVLQYSPGGRCHSNTQFSTEPQPLDLRDGQPRR